MKPLTAVGGALLLTLSVLLAIGCVQPGDTAQRPTPDAAANRMRALESRINQLEKNLDKIRNQQLEQQAGADGDAGLELRLTALTNPKLPAPAPAGITADNATAEQQALVARIAACIRQSGAKTTDEALHNAWRIAAGVTDTSRLRLVADVICQSAADAR